LDAGVTALAVLPGVTSLTYAGKVWPLADLNWSAELAHNCSLLSLAAMGLEFGVTPAAPEILSAEAVCVGGVGNWSQRAYITTDTPCICRFKSGCGQTLGDIHFGSLSWSAWTAQYTNLTIGYFSDTGGSGYYWAFQVEAKDAYEQASPDNPGTDNFQYTVDQECP